MKRLSRLGGSVSSRLVTTKRPPPRARVVLEGDGESGSTPRLKAAPVRRACEITPLSCPNGVCSSMVKMGKHSGLRGL